jgi:hypothetical protein
MNLAAAAATLVLIAAVAIVIAAGLISRLIARREVEATRGRVEGGEP